MRQCRTCGAALDQGANFCGECGSAITITAPAIPPNAGASVSSSTKTSIVAIAAPRRIRPPAPASVSVRYGPTSTRVQPRPLIQQPTVAPRRPVYPKSRFLAAALEWLFPGLGLMYASSFWKGVLVLLATFIGTGAVLSVAMSNANGAQLEDVLDFLVWLFLAHLVWLLVRMIWAWRLASRATRLSRLTA